MSLMTLDGVSFATVHDMLNEHDETKRHRIPISMEELNSMVEFVEGTKLYTPSSHPEWKYNTDPHFHYIKRVDDSTGVLQSRSWIKIPGVPPQVVFHALYNSNARRAFDKYYNRFEVSRVVSPNLDVLISEISLPMVSNREFVEWRYSCTPASNSGSRSEHRYVIYLRSCDSSACSDEVCPSTKKKVERAEVWMSGYIVSWWFAPDNSTILGSELLVLSHVDSRGSLPKIALTAMGSSGPSKWANSLEEYVKRITKEKRINLDMSDEAISEVLAQDEETTKRSG
jgi:hypothetical protein